MAKLSFSQIIPVETVPWQTCLPHPPCMVGNAVRVLKTLGITYTRSCTEVMYLSEHRGFG